MSDKKKIILSIIALLLTIPILYLEYDLLKLIKLIQSPSGLEGIDTSYELSVSFHLFVSYYVTMGLLAFSLGLYTYRFILGKLAFYITILSPIISFLSIPYI